MLGGQLKSRHRCPSEGKSGWTLQSRPSVSQRLHGNAVSTSHSNKGDTNSWDESGWGKHPLPSILCLTDVGLSGAPAMRFHLCGSKLDVNNSGFGVGPAMYMQGPIAEIALYERPDPGKREWKLVGVYPVSCDGYAQLDLKELAGKGQTADTVLYAAPGYWLKKLQGLAWPSTIVITREEVVL